MSIEVLNPSVPQVAPAEPSSTGVERKQLNTIRRRRLFQLGMLGWLIADVAVAISSVAIAFLMSPYLAVEVLSLEAGLKLSPVNFLPFAIFYAVCLGTISHILGLHDPRLKRQFGGTVAAISSAVGVALLLTSFGFWLYSYQLVGRYALVLTGIASLVGLNASRLLADFGTTKSKHAVFFLGSDRFCFRAAQLADESHLSQTVFTTLDYENREEEAEQSLCDWALLHGIDQIVFDAKSCPIADDQLIKCLENGIRVSGYPDFIEDNMGFVPVEQIEAEWMFCSRLDLTRPYYYGFKRIAEVVACSIGLLVLSPIMLFLIVLIKLESRGGAFYSQIRVGQFNRHFKIFKLRSMVSDAENSEGAQWAKKNDVRVTRLGRFLRKSRFDEVPQLWNVIRGDMSLIGPRPERPTFVDLLSDEIPFYAQRHLVMPGITGWAQINYPYGASIADAENKLAYDLYYVKRASFLLDLQIVLRTIGAVAKGAR